MAKGRILVIDDDPMIREILKAMLESESYEVTLADDGKVGVEYLDKEPRPITYSLIGLAIVIGAFVISNIVTSLASSAFGG